MWPVPLWLPMSQGAVICVPNKHIFPSVENFISARKEGRKMSGNPLIQWLPLEIITGIFWKYSKLSALPYDSFLFKNIYPKMTGTRVHKSLCVTNQAHCDHDYRKLISKHGDWRGLGTRTDAADRNSRGREATYAVTGRLAAASSAAPLHSLKTWYASSCSRENQSPWRCL